MEHKKFIIWTDINLNVDDWRDDLLADEPDLDESGLYDRMLEINADYLYDERENLNIKVAEEIIAIADLGLWDGRRQAYKIIPSGKLSDCLVSNEGYAEFFVDENNEFALREIHHDGTNYIVYRKFRAGLSPKKREQLLNDLYNNAATDAEIDSCTVKLGRKVRSVYL